VIGGRFKRPPHRRVTDSHESCRAEPKASTAPSVGLPQRSSERAFHLEQGFAFLENPSIGWERRLDPIQISRASEIWTPIGTEGRSTRDR